MRPLVLLLAVLSVTGCDSALTDGEAFSASLSTDGDAYAPRATATLRVENTGTIPIEFGPPACYATLESEGSSGAWAAVAREGGPVCADVVVVLPPGEAAESSIPLDTQTGTYRLRLNVSDGDEELRLATDPFVIG